MSFEMEKGKFYLMPVVFGPISTPRGTPDGRRCCYSNPMGTYYDHYRVIFEADPEKLETILPKGFSLVKPYIILSFTSLRNVAYLAGRGYELVSIEIPAKFKGEEDEVIGLFEPVLWEDHGDNCNIGREQSGFAKVFGDIEHAVIKDNKAKGSVSTWGFKFLEMSIDFDQEPENPEEMKAITENFTESEGRLHYKYIPKTGYPWTEADCEYVTLAPKTWEPEPGFDTTNIPAPSFVYGKGNVKWNRPEWRDAPTQSQIIQYFADLEVKRYIGAVKHSCNSIQDLRNLRILK